MAIPFPNGLTLLYMFRAFFWAFTAGVFVFNLSQRIREAWNLKSESEPEPSELAMVLRKAAMKDRTVILTSVNEAWAAPNSMLGLFLESFKIGEGTSHLLNHLVIIAMDQKAFDWCRSVHKHCFSLKTDGVDFSAEKRFMTEGYLKMMWRRIEFLGSVLQLGYHFIFTDADVMWLRNPFTHLTALPDITIACDKFLRDPLDKKNVANGGFYQVRSNGITEEFYKYWYMARNVYPGLHDQDVFNKIKSDEAASQMGVKIRFLDTAYFIGFCQKTIHLDKVCTVHANCCVGIERKLHDLRMVIEDWRNFTALSTAEKILKNGTTSRAPIKCKWPS